MVLCGVWYDGVIEDTYSVDVDIGRDSYHYQRDQGIDFEDYQEDQEGSVVVVAYAVVHYDAMMIESFDAFAASHAMHCGRGP